MIVIVLVVFTIVFVVLVIVNFVLNRGLLLFSLWYFRIRCYCGVSWPETRLKAT